MNYKALLLLFLITGFLYVAVNLNPSLRPIILIVAAIAWGIGLTQIHKSKPSCKKKE